MFPSLAAAILAASSLGRVSAAIPAKIYGVNIGSWLVYEPWMAPRGTLFIFMASRLLTLLCRVGPDGRRAMLSMYRMHWF